MNEPWISILLGALAAWVLVVGVGTFAVHRRRHVAAWVDLLGVWAGAVSAVALGLGRAGFLSAWASAVLLVAVAVTATLYDRAVILPSIEAAEKRTGHDAKWARDERYLWRMSHGARWLTLLLVAGALWVAAPL